MNDYIFLGINSADGVGVIAYEKDGRYFIKLDDEKEISKAFYESILREFNNN